MSTRRVGVLIVVLVSLGGLAVAQGDDPPLVNWGAPPYWLPSGASAAGAAPAVEGSAGVGEAEAVRTLPLVAMAPCRLFDSRAAGSSALLPPG